MHGTLSCSLSPRDPNGNSRAAYRHADKGDDTVSVDQTPAQATVAVESVSGIGGLELTWNAATPPAALMLQLHLAGLEELRLQGGGVTVQASVSSTPPYPTHATLLSDPTAAPMPLAPGDPFWPAIDIVACGRC